MESKKIHMTLFKCSFLSSIVLFIDCSRICPSGGTLSSDCEVCECSSSTIIGIVTDQTNFTLDEVKVYLSYRPWSPIATTNIHGRYTVSNLCFDSATVLAKSNGYSTMTTTPRRLNTTHFEANFQMRRLGLFNT